ncbi:uncharacterized protein LOC119730634 [Patiria miniata]|uniref:Reverse transcriptase domain-containing protein n=1 Tax=Patiria miniata TaxID=46514 RepID=A0A914A7Z0_PATMI|nr:uncharacterized protein LOC119730634 [Patiria miniata]
MEHIVLSHMAKYLAANNIIIDNQHGFREKLSCETQLIQAVDDWAFNINNKHQTDVLFLDFSMAFDRVAHRKLLHKLEYYGIIGRAKAWIQGFLSADTARPINITSSTCNNSPELTATSIALSRELFGFGTGYQWLRLLRPP